MTEVAFHFNAPDKVVYASRLLRKAYLKGARLLVLVKPQDADGLEHLLWTMGAVEFVPHCLDTAPPNVRTFSPIVIACNGIPESFNADVLLNLMDGIPAGYDRFERIIEVVTPDESDRLRARDRWRQYKSEGREPKRHDLNLRA